MPPLREHPVTSSLLAVLLACAPEPDRGALLPDAVVERLARDGRAEVFVNLDPPSSGSPKDDAWAVEVKRRQDAFLRCAGLTRPQVLRQWVSLPSLFLRVDAADLERARQCPDVEAFGVSRTFMPSLADSTAVIGATRAHDVGRRGAGQTVAVLDTGAYWTVSELGGCYGAGCKVAGGYDFGDGDDSPWDCQGHGTNVAAIAAGTAGVAPDADILAYKVFSDWSCGAADSESIGDALDDAVTNAASTNLVAINMSLGTADAISTACRGTGDPSEAGIRAAYDAGIVVSISSGNSGHADAVGFPACLARSITVANSYDAPISGATYCLDSWCSTTCTDGAVGPDAINCGSNGGSLVELAAPGTTIYAGGYSMSGTSQAAPHVAGAAALVAEATPGATAAERTDFLLRSAATVTDTRTGAAIVYPRLDLDTIFLGRGDDVLVTTEAVVDADADGALRPGESASLDLLAANNGPGDVDAVVVQVTSADPDLVVEDASAIWSLLDAWSTASNASDPVTVRVSAACVEPRTVLVDLEWEAADGMGGANQAAIDLDCFVDTDDDGWDDREDCAPQDANAHPDGEELCGGGDEDCDGLTDEDDASGAVLWYADADGDGHGDPDDTRTACAAPGEGWVAGSDDCDDTDADAFPGADDACDAIDQDCDGVARERCPAEEEPEGCGCATGSPGGVIAVALAAALARRRRHDDRTRPRRHAVRIGRKVTR